MLIDLNKRGATGSSFFIPCMKAQFLLELMSHKNRCMKKISTLFLILLSVACYSQDVPHSEEEAFADMFVGAGVSNEGVATGATVEMCMFGISTGLRATVHGFMPGPGLQAGEIGLLAGYKHARGRFHISFSGGYSLTVYSSDPVTNPELKSSRKGGSYSGITGQVQMVRKFSERTGLGLLGFANFNKRSDLYGAMLMFNFAL
jgi:hypothetical protein